VREIDAGHHFEQLSAHMIHSGTRVATSSGFVGQCCIGTIESAENCCTPDRIAALPSARCCKDGEVVDPSTSTCIKSTDIPALPGFCLPEQRTTLGTCCFPPMVPLGPVCGPKINIPGQPPGPPPTPTPGTQFGILWTDTIHFLKDHPAPGETDEGKILTSAGSGELASVQNWLTLSPDLQVRLVGHASSEGPGPDYKRLSERRARFVAGKAAGRLAEPLVPDTAAAGCAPLSAGVWACGAKMADQTSANPEDRVVRVTFIRNTLPKLPPLQLPPLQRPPTMKPPGSGQ
jgi:hypothetical protein